MPDALRVSNLRAGYGETVILEDVALTLPERGSLAVLGRNGVGKTTLMSTIMGHTSFHAGSIHFQGTAVERLPVYERVRQGIGYVPQGRDIFPSLSVEENLSVAAREGKRWTVERVYDLFPRLAERRKLGAGSLSGGEQQMLVIGRALLTNPRLLIMDEPSEGLAPVVVEHLVETLKRLSSEGIRMLVVEQKLAVATALAERVLIMVTGRIALETTATALLADTDAQRRYLGVSSLP
jgi:branched-chain amino acid transport system ATP-binding protein